MEQSWSTMFKNPQWDNHNVEIKYESDYSLDSGMEITDCPSVRDR